MLPSQTATCFICPPFDILALNNAIFALDNVCLPALSGLAYVFALARCRPSPLYVLDEIDAALDESNQSAVSCLAEGRERGKEVSIGVWILQ